MPTIINLFMSYVCAKHQNQELVVVQPSNQACQVTPCPKCQADFDFHNNNHIALIQSLQERLEKIKDPIKP